jgi:hypothetical protein
MDQLAGPLALVALGRLKPQPAQAAHPDPLKDPRDRRDGHAEQLGDLGPGEPEPAQRSDRFDPPLIGAIGDHARGAAAIPQTALSGSPVASHPLPTGSFTGLCCRRGSLDRPALLEHPDHHPAPLRQ